MTTHHSTYAAFRRGAWRLGGRSARSADARAAVRIACGVLIVAIAVLGAKPPAIAQPRDPFFEARQQMVANEIAGAGVTNERVLDAMRKTPRHEFVLRTQRDWAYYDMALPIGESQTISPPFIVAYMTEQLDPQPGDKVLEIGTGSGYQAAVLSPLVAEVYSIEIVEALGQRAARTLKRLGYENVHTKIGDGYQGWAEHAPFDKIIVTCSPENVPQALVDQLKPGGRMIIPLGERYQQTLYLFQKKDGELVSEALRPTLFVPMTGAAEEERKVKPDPTRPEIVNGGFETVTDGELARWHYQRQLEIVEDPTSPEGVRYVKFKNVTPGRGSQALQGFAIDGRRVSEIELSCWVKGDRLSAGSNRTEMPAVMITFYDERRATIGSRGLGPWQGTFSWRAASQRLEVPYRAREAIIYVGLLGGVGELCLDDVRITVSRYGR